ncbi:proline-rich domain-containing protein [Pseudomonas frederiksbergensis]
MSGSDTTVDIETGIANYDFLKLVDGYYLDIVSHYVNIWQAYHQVFTKVAMDLVMYGGIAWVGVLALKAPVDKLRTAAGAMTIVLLTGMLLQPGNYKVGPAQSQVGLAAGAGYSLSIIGSIYALFKSALDSVNKEGANALAFNNAYHVTNAATVDRYANSPLAPMMSDYISRCQNAIESSGTATEETRKTGWAVGLFGSSGIGQSEAQFTMSKEMLEAIKNKDKDLTKYMSSSVPFTMYDESMTVANSENKIQDGIAKGITMLNSIPDDANPYFSGQYPAGGYKLPTQAYWQTLLGGKGSGPEMEDAVSGALGNAYQSSAYDSAGGPPVPADQRQSFYPKNCAQMYLLVAKGVENYNAAAAAVGMGGQKTALMRDGMSAQTMLIQQINAKIAQDKLKSTSLQNMRPYANQLYPGQETPSLLSAVADSTMTGMQDIGMKFREWMLKFKIPAMINGCAMLAGILIVLFPLICVFAVFISPNILISYVKLLVFAFTVPFINDMCLTMASSLLAMNGELMEGYNAGNYTENWALLISAASAQYIIFIALTAVEIIIAKMLIWDDVKGLSGFNPGGAATGMAATGLAISGAVLKAASMAIGGGKMLAKGGSAIAGGATAAGGKIAGGGSSVASITSAYGNMTANYSVPNASSGSRNSIGLNPVKSSPKPPSNNGGGASGGGGGGHQGGGSNQNGGSSGRTPPPSGGATPTGGARTSPGNSDQTPPKSAGKYPDHPKPPTPSGPKKP